MRLLTLARDLKRRKARERLGLFVAEGIRAAEELLASPLTVRGALAGPALAQSPRGEALRADIASRGIPLLDLAERELTSAAGTESPQGIILIGEAPSRDIRTLTVPGRARILVLDGVQDPGNLGTLLRTAAALGVHATLALPGTVDLWNSKVVRSAMGALFHHPVFNGTWEELDEFLKGAGAELWGADSSGEPVDDVAAPAVLALAVGNEGGGLSDQCRARVARLVAVPITGAESLNVAVATGIILYQLGT